MTNKSCPRPTIWEAIGITMGAIALLFAGLAGLGLKASRNAFEPQRAEDIALSIVSYQLPGQTKGVFGVHIGGLKIAQVNSYDSQGQDASVPEVELIMARVLLDNKKNNIDPQENLDPQENPLTFPFYQDDKFQIATELTKNKPLCGLQVPVTIQKGTLTVTDEANVVPVSAVRYIARVVFSDYQLLIKITSTAPDAEKKADLVFNSLKCHENPTELILNRNQ